MPERPVIRLQTTVYRFHNPRWAFAPESGEGARRHGGRFNPRGIAALYTSLHPITALYEANQDLQAVQPSTICSYAVDCTDILDISTPERCQAAGIDYDILGIGWELIHADGDIPATWDLAQQLIKARVAGIVVPSFAINTTSECRNVVFWDWSREPPHQVQVNDDFGRLPHDQSSWKSS